MKTLRILKIDFENEIHEYEIPAYRAAIGIEIGEGNVLFHHHLDEQTYLNKYPLIQYKFNHQKLSILLLNEATEQVYKFLTQESWKIYIGKTEKILKTQKINIYHEKLNFIDIPKTYKISQWLALNEDNYNTFKEMNSLKEKVELLEKILKAHILAFAEGIQWNISQPIQLSILDIHKQKWIKYKKIGLLSFDVSFEANLTLPNYIGLGKSTSLGFGVVNLKNFSLKEKKT